MWINKATTAAAPAEPADQRAPEGALAAEAVVTARDRQRRRREQVPVRADFVVVDRRMAIAPIGKLPPEL